MAGLFSLTGTLQPELLHW